MLRFGSFVTVLSSFSGHPGLDLRSFLWATCSDALPLAVHNEDVTACLLVIHTPLMLFGPLSSRKKG
jgi:hypothetical protein